MTRASLFVALFLLLSAVTARADTIPTWHLTASGEFGGLINQQPVDAESFTANLTLTFAPVFGEFEQLWTGTVSFTGVLGTFSQTYTDASPNAADGGFLAAFDSFGDEVDFNVGPLDVAALVPPSMLNDPPFIGVPYLYSCNVPAVCAAFGTQTGIGLFAGVGNVTQTTTELPPAVPEPGTLLLLLTVIPVAGVKRLIAALSRTKSAERLTA